MSVAPAVLILTVLETAWNSSAQDSLAPGSIRIDDVLEDHLPTSEDPTALLLYWWTAESTEPAYVSLESVDFEPALRVIDQDGRLLPQNEDEGIGWNRVVATNAVRGRRYRIEVLAENGGEGDFLLRIARGRPLLLSGEAYWRASIEYHTRGAQVSLERDRILVASQHRRRVARYLLKLSQTTGREDLLGARKAYEDATLLSQRAGDDFGAAQSIRGLGQVADEMGDYLSTFVHYRDALEVYRSTGRRDEESRLLYLMGKAQKEIGESTQARTALRDALDLAREIKHPFVEPQVLEALADLEFDLGEIDSAEASYQELLDLAQGTGNSWAHRVALIGLGGVALARGDDAQEGRLWEKALDSFQPGPIVPIYHGQVADICFQQRELEKAEFHYSKALDLSRRIKDRKGLAIYLGNLALVASLKGEVQLALERFEECLALDPKDHPDSHLRQLGNLGGLHLSLDDFPRARECFEGQRNLARELGNTYEERDGLRNLAMLEHDLGNYRFSRQLALDSLNISRRAGALHHEGDLLRMLGDAHLHLLDLKSSRECADQLSALGERLGDPSFRRNADTLRAGIAEREGDHESAIARWEDLLDRAKEQHDESFESVALNNLALELLALGQAARAKDCIKASIALKRQRGDESALLHSLQVAARIALAERDSKAAMEAFEEGLRILRRPWISSLSCQDQAGVRSRFADWGTIAQDFAALQVEEAGTDPDARERARRFGFESAGLWKGQALLKSILQGRGGNRTAESQALRVELRHLKRQRELLQSEINGLRASSSDLDSLENLRTELSDLDARMEAVAARMSGPGPIGLAMDTFSVESARLALCNERRALIEYAEGRERLFAYLLTDESFEMVGLSRLADVRRETREFLQYVCGSEARSSATAVQASGHALFRQVLEPVLRELKGSIEELLIVPSTHLADLPFEAMVMTSEGEPKTCLDLSFVRGRYRVSYGPSTPVLVELSHSTPSKDRGRLLILADPLFASEATSHMRAPVDPFVFQRLPGTRTEALSIVTAVSRGKPGEDLNALQQALSERSGQLSLPQLDIYWGDRASKTALNQDLSQYRILHLATHGFVDRENPTQSGLALSFSKEDSGYLTVAEVLDFSLGADLVVLSACNTGAGEPLAGEGVQSLARAFLFAGAESVVASLWQVSDPATALAMKQLHSGLQDGFDAREALNGALASLRSSSEWRGVEPVQSDVRSPPAIDPDHPFYWAPWIFIGVPGPR